MVGLIRRYLSISLSISTHFSHIRNAHLVDLLFFYDGVQSTSDSDLADCLAATWRMRADGIGFCRSVAPGEAITPRPQGESFSRCLVVRPNSSASRWPWTPIGGLGMLGLIAPSLADKAELARIGRYYATESMLVLDPQTGTYDAAATPSTGTKTLFDFYRSVLAGADAPERGDHAIF
jgi:divinyl chlorophyllide a 8-vinyl-reductase